MTGSSLEAINSSIKFLKITGPALSRISSVIISARTVMSGLGHREDGFHSGGVRRLSGLLNRLNAILSLLHPLDRYRDPLCDSECDWKAPISPYLASKNRWESLTASF